MAVTGNQINFKTTDWLRGLAALYVTISHCRVWLYAGGSYYQTLHPRQTWNTGDYAYHAFISLTRLSTEFVVLFFLISGFSIAHSLSAKPAVTGFYRRRLIRIYPPYLLALLWAALVFIIAIHYAPVLFACTLPTAVFEGLCNSKEFLQPERIAQNIFFIPYGSFITQFWSITHEVIFYLLVPVFLLNRTIYFVLSAVAYLISWPLQGWGFNTSDILQTYFLHINFYFASGIFLYTHFDRLKRLLPGKTVFYALSLPVLLILMFAVNLYFGAATKISGLIAALFSFLLIFRVIDKRIIIRWLAFIGTFSYSLYLTHVASILLLMAVFSSFSVDFPVTSRWLWLTGPPFCLLIAYVAWLLVEKRTQKRKNSTFDVPKKN